MELPIELKFFKKLELYQEIMFQDLKSKRATDPERKKIWATEKEILKWTVFNHHHVTSSIDHTYIKSKIIDSSGKWGNLSKVTNNLIGRGYAVKEQTNNPTSIIFTREGLLMGEVVNDVIEGNFLTRAKYPFFIILTWLVIIIGILVLIMTLIDLLIRLYFTTQ